MLERIKKRQYEGFKEFVQNLETSPRNTRQQILLIGTLEDPLFMQSVMKNIKNFENFLELPSAEIVDVIQAQEQFINLFAKAIYGEQSLLMKLDELIPRYASKIREELSYMGGVTAMEKEGARFHFIKKARALGAEEKIHGFSWHLPDVSIFHVGNLDDGRLEIKFENGILAAEGDIFRGQRTGEWSHYYDSGKLLAQGRYVLGLKQGEWKFYYPNGSLKALGRFVEDLRHGQWKEWDRNNEVKEMYYEEGVRK